MFDSRYLFEDKTGCELPASQYALKIPSGDDYHAQKKFVSNTAVL